MDLECSSKRDERFPWKRTLKKSTYALMRRLVITYSESLPNEQKSYLFSQLCGWSFLHVEARRAY